jgi:hypothetical protein
MQLKRIPANASVTIPEEMADALAYWSRDACACRKLDPARESGLSSENAEHRRYHSYRGRDGTTGAVQSRVPFPPE